MTRGLFKPVVIAEPADRARVCFLARGLGEHFSRGRAAEAGRPFYCPALKRSFWRCSPNGRR